MDRLISTPERSSKRRGPVIEFTRIAFVIGIMLLVLTVFMMPPAIIDIFAGNADWQVFAGSGFFTGFIGLMLVVMSRGGWSRDVSLKEGFVLTVASWVSLCTVAAIPFVFFQTEAENQLTLVDAWFEAVSGLTATGATIFIGLDDLPPGILLWRSIIQWIGGIGIVVMAMVMLPFLRVGGMQLFQAESSDISDKFVPRARELMGYIALTYLILTIICGLAYRFAGMSGFDALNHAMTTLATGGFSTHDNSFAFFDNAAIHWIAVIFMLAGSLPLVIYVKTVRGLSLESFGEQQVRGFLALTAFAVFGLTLWLAQRPEVAFLDALRIVSFNVVSIISTSGYSLGDYTAWGSGAVGAFFVLMFLGGCTGSTTGGIKTFRLQVMLISAANYIKQLMSPNRVVIATYDHKRLTPDISSSVLAYISVMLISVMLFTVIFAFFGLDFVTSVSAALSALANIGPGLGSLIGPAGNFAELPLTAKFIMAVGMLLGRLEFFTVLVLLHPDFWR